MNARTNRLLGCKLVHVAAFLLGLGAVARAQMPAPDPLVVTAVTANTVSLAWNDIYSDEDGFLLTRWDNHGNQTTFQFGPNVTDYVDTNLITSSLYSYQVVAFNSGGQSYPAWAQATPTPIPAPDPLLITGVTANTVGLSWNDIYTNEDGFILTRYDNRGNQASFQFDANVTNYLDTNLITGSIYYYSVLAFNSGGQSYPAWAQATPTPIAAPDPLLITGVTANTVGLSWNDIYTNEDGFVLTRYDNHGNQASFQFAANVTNYLDTNLITGLLYSYSVLAFNSGGQSYPAWAQATPTPIPAPAPLVISGVTANTVGLVWNDIYNDEDGYVLTRYDNFGNQRTFQFGPNVTSYLDTNLITGTLYSYSVVAFNSGGQSYPAFNSATPTPIAGPAPLQITGVTSNTINLTWNDIYDNEDGFVLTRWDNLGNQATFQFGPNVTNYTDTNLVTGTSYYYQVVAFNSGGQSAAAYNSATPTPNPSPAPLQLTVISSNTFSLTWRDIFGNEDGFQLERSTDSVNFAVITLTGPNVTNYTDTPPPASDYFYRVAAFNSNGLSAYAITNITIIPTPPAAPSGLTALAVSPLEVALTWIDNAYNETQFYFERSTNGVDFTPLGTFYGANATNVSIGNELPAHTYYFRVRAQNAAGVSPWSNIASATTPDFAPPTPQNFTATSVSTTEILLNWTTFIPSDWQGLININGHHIYISGDGTNFTFLDTVTNGWSYASIGLNPATTYYYRVTSFNTAGDSVPTPVVSATTQDVLPPSGLSVTAISGSQIDLSWTDNATNEIGFNVYISTNGFFYRLVATLGSNVTSYSSTGLRPLTTYYYRVTAFSSASESAPSNVGLATTADGVPVSPSGLKVTSGSTSLINLAWTDNSINESGFKVYISTDGTNFTLQATRGSNVTSYSSTGLIPGTTYYYRVTAFNAFGESAASSTISVATLNVVPLSPTALSATAISATQINLSWTDNANNESGFNVYISTNGTNFTLLATLGANVTTYASTGLNSTTTYYYRVTAFNAVGESAAASANATIPDAVPVSPSGLSATAISATQISLSWTDNANNEAGFKVYISTDGTTFSLLATLGTNVTSYSSTGLSSATTYYYRVTAFNAIGESAASSANAATPDVLPAAPSGFSANAVSATQINLSWVDNANNETGFKVYISTNGTTFSLLATLGANVTTYSSTGLNSATTYYYRVTAFNAIGESAPASGNATTPDVVPASPSGLSASVVSATQINLSWTDNANNETGFKVYISTNGTTFSLLATRGANVTSYLSTGLSLGTTYYYRVTAFNAVGESAPSNANATTPVVPAAPSGLTATGISTTQINLSWTDNATNETGFKVYLYNPATQIFSLLATLGANVTNYSSTNLNPVTAYTYRVTAFNAAGESTPVSASATTADFVPASPSGFSAIAASFGTQINLTWTDNANNETGFKVYMSTNGTTFSLLATIGYANVPFYTKTGLNPGTTYYFRVTAFNASGESTPASTNATTPDVPSSPSGLSAIALSTSQLNLSWTDNATNETGFKVYFSTDGTIFNVWATLGVNVTNYASTGLNTASTYYYRVVAFNDVGESTPASTNGTTDDVAPRAPWFLYTTTISATQVDLTWGDIANNETGFTVYISTDGTNFSLLATVGPNVTSYSSTGLNPATTYYYRVTAFNSFGESAPSETASATTPDVPPLAPSGLSASAVSSNTVTLNWTDNANNEWGFLIERSTDGVNFTQIGSVAGATTYTDSGLAAETTYYYRVRATNTAGNSAYSNIASATTGPAAPPATPSNLTLTVISANQIDLHWNDNSSNETQFLIERSPNANSFTQIATVGANAQSYSATGLQSNTRYYFRVRATNSAGNSAYSNTANAKTSPH